jgi:hypothetical protein
VIRRANDASSAGMPSPSTRTPVSLPSWPAIIVTATPAMYPTRIGRDSRSATNPRRAAEAARHSPPTTTARAAASPAYRAGSPAASGATAAAVIRAVVDSGPTDSCRDEPRTAYRASGARIAHSPVTGGSPARPAYAITWGTRYAATVTPASRSPRSHDRRYPRSTAAPGSHVVTGTGTPCRSPG